VDIKDNLLKKVDLMQVDMEEKLLIYLVCSNKYRHGWHGRYLLVLDRVSIAHGLIEIMIEVIKCAWQIWLGGSRT